LTTDDASAAVFLDTCAIIDLAEGRLPSQVIEELDKAALGGGVFVSSVSAWEIGLLGRRGRAGLAFLPDPATWFARILARPAIQPVNLTPEVAIASSALPEPLHSDPADRMLIATALDMGARLATCDRKIILYAPAVRLEVIAY
jgi:PIN domain nuclease of toxin-antitoxin system